MGHNTAEPNQGSLVQRLGVVRGHVRGWRFGVPSQRDVADSNI